MALRADGWIDLAEINGTRCAVLVVDGVPVRVSVRAPDQDASWDSDDAETLRIEVEERTNCWIEAFSPHGWSAAEGENESVHPVTLLDDQPTHRIEFRCGLGAAQIAAARPHVFLVQLDSDGPAYERCDIEDCSNASWAVDDGHWYCEGQATPGGANGEVAVEALLAPVGVS